MTQWLIEEAAYLAMALDDARADQEATQEHQEEQLLLSRHAEMAALRERMKAE